MKCRSINLLLDASFIYKTTSNSPNVNRGDSIRPAAIYNGDLNEVFNWVLCLDDD